MSVYTHWVGIPGQHWGQRNLNVCCHFIHTIGLRNFIPQVKAQDLGNDLLQWIHQGTPEEYSCAHLGKEKHLLPVKVHLTSRVVFPPLHILSCWQVSQNPYELWLCSHWSPEFQSATPWTPRWHCIFTLTTRSPSKASSPRALCTQVGRTLHFCFFTHKINTPIFCPVHPHKAEETRKCWEVFWSWREKMPWK